MGESSDRRDDTSGFTDRRRLEDRLQLALESAGMGIWEWEIASGEVRWSPEVERVFRLEPGTFAGTYEAYLGLVHPGDRDELVTRVDRALRDPTYDYRVTHRLCPPGGGMRWIEGRGRVRRSVAGEAVAMLGTVWDVTEHKRIEEALRASRDWTSYLMRVVPDHILTVTPDGTITDLNHAGEGFTPEEVVGRNAVHFTHPDDREEYFAALAAHFADGAPRELDVRDVNGRGYRVRIVPMGDRAQRDLCLVICADITDRLSAERDLASHRERLLHAERMEMVGRLAGGLMHDFNNVLTGVLGAAELGTEEGRTREEVERYLGIAGAAAARGAALTGQLLGISRWEPRAEAVVDLREVLADLSGILDSVLGEAIALESTLDGDPLTVRGDRGLLEQVILNLAINGRDAMRGGGSLRIDVRREDQGRVAIAVADRGCGIPDEARDLIFEPFYTTKPRGRGTGLGLANCAAIVAQHRGTIEVDSTPGEGTTMRVLLPAVEDAPADAGRRISDVDDMPPLRILLVEDDDLVRELIHEQLADRGHHVRACTDARAARVAVEEGFDPELLVTDLVLPDADGLSLLAELRPRLGDLAAVVVTGHHDRAGGLPIDRRTVALRKPFKFRDLRRAVAACTA